jgi:hypothetical protein
MMLFGGCSVGVRVGLGVIVAVGCAVGILVGADVALGVGDALELLSILLGATVRNAANNKLAIKMPAIMTIIMLRWRSDRQREGSG